VEKLTISHGKSALYFKYDGEVTLDVTPELKRRLEAELAGNEVAAVVLDLSGVGFMDSSGIGFLVSINTRMRSIGKACYLCRLSPKVRKTLGLVQLLSYFQVVENEEDVAALLS